MLKVELHLHTCYSPDACITYPDLLKAHSEKKFDVVAVTDHNTIEGALKMKKENKIPVIVGEEITMKNHQELIGLFLKERIPPFMTIQETIQAIHRQGGLVSAPHPFSFFRIGVGQELENKEIAGIHFFEVFNAFGGRFWQRNDRAGEFARQTPKLVPVVGSDAHFPDEIGSAVNLINVRSPQEVMTPRGLYQCLKKSFFQTESFPITHHFVRRSFYCGKSCLMSFFHLGNFTS